MPKLSVAMATYNGEKFIQKQLESLFLQTRALDEVVIVDDASTDATARIISRFIHSKKLSGWRLIRNTRNVGYFRNFGRAVSLLTGDILFLCDQDDVWDARKVERSVQVLEEHPELDLLSVGYDTIDAKGEPCPAPGVRFVSAKTDGSLERLGAHTFVGCSYIRGFSIAFRASVRDYIPWRDPGRLLSHDWLICMSAGAMRPGALETPRCALLHECLAHYRVHGNNVTARARANSMIDTRVRVKALEDSRNAHEAFLREFLSIRQKDGAAIITQEDNNFVRDMQRQIAFENERLRFAQTKNPLRFLWLGARVWKYKCYYKSFRGALRVLAGDLAYAYRGKRR